MYYCVWSLEIVGLRFSPVGHFKALWGLHLYDVGKNEVVWFYPETDLPDLSAENIAVQLLEIFGDVIYSMRCIRRYTSIILPAVAANF